MMYYEILYRNTAGVREHSSSDIKMIRTLSSSHAWVGDSSQKRLYSNMAFNSVALSDEHLMKTEQVSQDLGSTSIHV